MLIYTGYKVVELQSVSSRNRATTASTHWPYINLACGFCQIVFIFRERLKSWAYSKLKERFMIACNPLDHQNVPQDSHHSAEVQCNPIHK